MKFDLGFLRDCGVDTDLGKEYTGGQDRYVSALSRFYRSFEVNRDKVREAFALNDLENYTLLVHALKSNCLMIGAVNLSKEFEALELAGKEKRMDALMADTERVLGDYEALAEILRPIGEADVEKPVDELTGDEAVKVVKELLEALDDFDDETSAELVKKLSGYPFRPRPKEKLKEAADYIERFLYDEAAKIIKGIVETIE